MASHDSRAMSRHSRAMSRRKFTGGIALSTLWATHLHAFDRFDLSTREAAERSRDANSNALVLADNPFTLGVASGDPWADSVVLWTRLAIDPLHGGAMPPANVSVQWAVAEDDGMKWIVQRGTETATAEWAHSVHAEVSGLKPDTWYWYQFRVGDHLSPIGRTRTFPKAGESVDQLRFAFVSCSNYEVGYFTAYKAMADEHPDVILHLGDYLYESAPTDGKPRKHSSPALLTLQNYRDRYAQYRTDPDLQKAHAECPWILTWDDHEVENNYANLISQRNDPVDQFKARRAAAYHAYYEHMPLRKSSMPHDAFAQIYRQLQYGSLTSFFVLDTRQYRSNQPCDDGTKVRCEAAYDASLTITGAAQEKWLFNGLDRSAAKWNVIPQQVMMGAVDQQPGPDIALSMDQWPGYPIESQRLMDFLGARKPSNPIVLTGDIHSNWVNDLKLDFRNEKSATVGTEFVVTSVTSGSDGSDISDRMRTVLTENPFVKFYNGQRGYVLCTLTDTSLRADYKVIDIITTPNGKATTRASFEVTSGHPGANRL